MSQEIKKSENMGLPLGTMFWQTEAGCGFIILIIYVYTSTRTQTVIFMDSAVQI